MKGLCTGLVLSLLGQVHLLPVDKLKKGFTESEMGETKNPQTCHKAASCGECIRGDGCGWCASDARCYAGTEMGAVGTNCTGVWDFGFCSSEPCSSYGSCDACTSDPLCGWCNTTTTDFPFCTEGTEKSPAFLQCPRKDWKYGVNGCANCACPDKHGLCRATTAAPTTTTEAKKAAGGGGEYKIKDLNHRRAATPPYQMEPPPPTAEAAAVAEAAAAAAAAQKAGAATMEALEGAV